jgi:hypothetical protein
MFQAIQSNDSFMSHDVHMNYKLLFYQTLLQWWWIILGACLSNLGEKTPFSNACM